MLGEIVGNVAEIVGRCPAMLMSETGISASPRITDIAHHRRHVREVPIPDECRFTSRCNLGGPTASKGGDDPPWATYENEDCQRRPQGQYAPDHEVLDNRRAAVKREAEGRSI